MKNWDKPIQATPPSIVIPYKNPQPAEVSKQETEFQKFGDTYGTYGDSYGSLNTLFSGLAFTILILSLFMQRQELQAQRQELEAQRNEIKESNNIAEGQRVITEQQAELIQQQIHDTKVQNFYNTLFKFLDEKRRKIERLEFSRTDGVKGHYIFEYFLSSVLYRMRQIEPHSEEILSIPDDRLAICIDEVIKTGHARTKKTLLENEYFEYISFILLFIKQHEHLGIVNTSINILVSYQDINEMYCMFIVSLKDNELKGYIREYALLRKLNTYNDTDKHILALVHRTIGNKAYKS